MWQWSESFQALPPPPPTHQTGQKVFNFRQSTNWECQNVYWSHDYYKIWPLQLQWDSDKGFKFFPGSFLSLSKLSHASLDFHVFRCHFRSTLNPKSCICNCWIFHIFSTWFLMLFSLSYFQSYIPSQMKKNHRKKIVFFISDFFK